jgi:hypothetical protein
MGVRVLLDLLINELSLPKFKARFKVGNEGVQYAPGEKLKLVQVQSHLQKSGYIRKKFVGSNPTRDE